ncbi:uncharacterized protein [Dasypus novemcinctus]|uniref:uncharacterized protein n=1 Tax=Dasypus novemcinctus TaxID=9361 RepID=UPI00265E474B|nr:uncharacterized protein LOC105745078 [Dasypus novemcinctus]XP_058144842.1 uncharacterized protein LOC105745078 [Dasypus novemcinctus]
MPPILSPTSSVPPSSPPHPLSPTSLSPHPLPHLRHPPTVSSPPPAPPPVSPPPPLSPPSSLPTSSTPHSLTSHIPASSASSAPSTQAPTCRRVRLLEPGPLHARRAHPASVTARPGACRSRRPGLPAVLCDPASLPLKTFWGLPVLSAERPEASAWPWGPVRSGPAHPSTPEPPPAFSVPPAASCCSARARGHCAPPASPLFCCLEGSPFTSLAPRASSSRKPSLPPSLGLRPAVDAVPEHLPHPLRGGNCVARSPSVLLRGGAEGEAGVLWKVPGTWHTVGAQSVVLKDRRDKEREGGLSTRVGGAEGRDPQDPPAAQGQRSTEGPPAEEAGQPGAAWARKVAGQRGHGAG